MKKFFQKLLAKLVKKAINKSVNDVVSNPDVSDVSALQDVEPITQPDDNSKKALWKFILQTLISILTALAAAITTTSCVNNF